MTQWARQLALGFGLALSLRVILTLSHGLLWILFHSQPGFTGLSIGGVVTEIPALATPLEEVVFGVWRRWDVVHYLNLASNGYQISDPGPTVFGPGAPLLFAAADRVLPGPVDLAAAVVQVILLGVALTLIGRICQTYYRDPELPSVAIMVCALLPMGYVWLAPTSETLFLTLTLAFFYAAVRGRWLVAALFAFLATITRSQGALLVLVAAALLFESRDRTVPLGRQVRTAVRRGWPVLIVPAGYLVFLVYRAGLGLPPLDEIYRQYSYGFFVDPLRSLLINLRWIIEHPSSLWTNPDILAMVIYGLLIALVLRDPHHRRPPLVVYTLATVLFVFTKVNYVYGTADVMYSQSFARYSLVLWPVHIFIADQLRRWPTSWRNAALVGLAISTVVMGILNMVYLAPP